MATERYGVRLRPAARATNGRRGSERTPANRSARKALQMLDYFRVHGRGRLSDLAAHAGLNLSTALRFALALEAQGALVREPATRQYSLGPWVLELASSLLREQPLLQQAHAVLVALRDQTGETASLWVRQGRNRVCVDRVESQHGLRGSVDLGARLPPHRGAAGKVFLATLPLEEREAVLAEVEREEGVSLDALRVELDQVARQAWAISVAEREPGVASVAVPIPDPRGVVNAALNVSGPITRFTHERRLAAIPLLQQAAARLSLYAFPRV